MKDNQTKSLVVNALVAGIYVVLYFIAPQVAYGPIQFRVSEGLNHLNGFHRHYKWGVTAGVFISNFYGFLNGLGWYDIVFGTAHTLISFLICDWIFKKVTKQSHRMIVTTIVFSVMIFIVGIELYWAFDLPFWYTYGTLILSELIIMSITAPIMAFADRRLHFAERMAD